MKHDKGCGRTNCLVVEDFRVTSVGISSSQLPHIKKRFPVDEFHQTVKVIRIKHTCAQELRMH